MPFPTVYMLTCPQRQASAKATLERWHETDWGTGPHCVMDGDPEAAGEEWGTPGRGARIAAVFAGMLAQALDDGGADDEWMLLLEDDLEFHPRIGTLVESWPALEDARCGLASLFNPMLRATPAWGEMPRAFAADPASFFPQTFALEADKSEGHRPPHAQEIPPHLREVSPNGLRSRSLHLVRPI